MIQGAGATNIVGKIRIKLCLEIFIQFYFFIGLAQLFNRLHQGFSDKFTAINTKVATLIGHGTVRRYVMEGEQGPPTQQQLGQMKGLVRDAMQEGAVGLSTGLAYSPGVYAHTGEVVELAKVVAAVGTP